MNSSNMDIHHQPPSTEEVREKLERSLGHQLVGYELQQIHGQRKLFNANLKQKYFPEEGCEVFVGKLPRDVYENELVPLFLSVAPVYEFRLMMNFSGCNRGFAFVTYFNRAAARRAVKQLDNFEVRPGRPIGVVLSHNNRKLFLGLIKENSWLLNPSSQLRDVLCEATDGVERVEIYETRRNKISYYHRTMYAIVTYVSHRDAAMARRSLIPIKKQIFGVEINLDWADPRLEAKRLFW